MHDPTPQMHREYNNTGVLWKNKHKRDLPPEERQDRDCNGDGTIDGVDYWLSGWTRKTKSGEKYVKLYFKKKTARRTNHAEVAGTEHSPA